MDIGRAKELLPILTAFTEGKAIQRLSSSNNTWLDTDNVTGKGDYRIKPKPRKFYLRCLDIPEHGFGRTVYVTSGYQQSSANFIEVVEVIAEEKDNG